MIRSIISLIAGLSASCSDAEEIATRYTLTALPFSEEWQIFWGGDTEELNHHHNVESQKHAIDAVISTDQEGYDTFKNEGKENSDYYCWKKPLKSVFDGTVMLVVNGIPDNIPGELNPQMVYGNTIMIEAVDGTVAVYAHLQLDSATVKVGDSVVTDQVIGLCGNSGNSSEPHLHFHLQSELGFEKGSGISMSFDKVRVNGQTKRDHSPIKGEKIKE